MNKILRGSKKGIGGEKMTEKLTRGHSEKSDGRERGLVVHDRGQSVGDPWTATTPARLVRHC